MEVKHMWNSVNTADYEGMIAETIRIKGYNDEYIHAYYSRPMGTGPFPSIVLIPHMPGWDEFSRETARRFTQHGYSVICPNIYERFGYGKPKEIASIVKQKGGTPDISVMGDVEASLSFLKNQTNTNGKSGVIGMCSGGRHTFLAACTLEGIDAAADLWGGGVIAEPESLTPAKPVAPVDYAEKLSCPLIGIFGNEDHNPVPEDVDKLEKILKDLNKEFEFYRYDGAGHAFWCYDQEKYRHAQAIDSFNKVLEFFNRYLK